MDLTPSMAGNTILAMGIAYVVTIAYSVYIAILNRKQAKIYELMEKNNALMQNNNALLEQIIHLLPKKNKK